MELLLILNKTGDLTTSIELGPVRPNSLAAIPIPIGRALCVSHQTSEFGHEKL